MPNADDACDRCGHTFGAHQVCGYKNPDFGIPTEGWMECPESGCECYSTWSISPALLTKVEEATSD